MAAKSKNATRRKRRKKARKMASPSQFSESQPATPRLHTGEEASKHNSESADGCDPAESDDGSATTDSGAAEEGEEASVLIATADFAMQNVILQMGLRLAAPDGRHITRISRWVLRCSACFKVTKVGLVHSLHSACLLGSCSNEALDESSSLAAQ